MVDIATTFIWFFRAENPFVPAFETDLRLVQIEQGQSEPVNGTGGILTDTVIDDQPSRFGFYWRG